jgi:hypothetical protein
MVKKIAVLVRNRQSEALRMSLGLTLVDDIIDVYMLNEKFAETEQDLLNIELMQEMEMKIYTSSKNNNGSMEYFSIDKIAHKLLEYDHVLPY